MRTALASLRAFCIDMGSHLILPLNGNGLGGPE